MSTLKTGALRGTSGTADSIQLHASNQSVTFPGDVTCSGTSTGFGPTYATGTWTPAFSTASGSVGTYSRQVGRYTKIGRIVYCSKRIQAEDGDADGATSITGLPFTSVDSEHQYVGQPYIYLPGAKTGQAHGKDLVGAGLEVSNNSTSMKVYVLPDDNEDMLPYQLDFGVCSDSLYIRIWHNFFYEASS